MLSGKAHGQLDWRLGSRWSGRLGADYSRSLADFANNLVLVKDLLTQKSSFANGTYLLGNRWTLSADVRWSSTSHGAQIRQVDDDNILTQKFGLGFSLSPSVTIGWNYRHSMPTSPGTKQAPTTGQYDRNYDESASNFWLKSALGSKTDFNLEGGYLRRNYPNAAIGNYSGGTGPGDARVASGSEDGAGCDRVARSPQRTLTRNRTILFRPAPALPQLGYQPSGSRLLWPQSWESQKYIGSEPAVLGDPFSQ